MIRSVRVKNFRCLESIALADLKKINVVVGDNAAGKTTLLESLFLGVGPSPELLLRLKRWRTGEASFAGSPAALNQEFWTDFFYGFDRTRSISIELEGTEGFTRTLHVGTATDSLVVPVGATGPTGPTGVESLPEFEWFTPTGNHKFKPRFTEQGLNLGGHVTPTPREAFFFNAQQTPQAAEIAGRFFELSRRNNEKRVVDVIRRQFPAVTDLTVGVSSGTNTLFASVAGLPEKITLSSVSSGLNKLVALLCSIPTKPGSVLLVDEIENGFHHRRLKHVWSALLDLCDQHDAQVFATTHSAECIAALADVMKKRPKDATLVRIETDKQGKTRAEQFLGTSFFRGLRLGELR